jgi:predicted ArsR family transcriptional regulator
MTEGGGRLLRLLGGIPFKPKWGSLLSETLIAEALSSDLAWRALNLLMKGEASRAEVREALGVTERSAKELLDKLVLAGLVTVRRRALPSGRRHSTYVLAERKDVGYPPRNYEYLSRALIKSLVGSLGEESAKMVLRDMSVRMGEEVGEMVLSQEGGKRPDPSGYAERVVMGFLAGMKVYPRVVRAGRRSVVYEERNCLFQELANELPHLVCDVLDEGVHEGLDRKLGVKTVRESCRGHGDSVCRFCVTWPPARPRKGRNPS